jgi:hypothetical protein
MIAALKDLIPRIDSWPSEDQEALVEAARGIEAERTGVYQATVEELAAIDRGLDDVRAGRLAALEALAEVRAKFRGSAESDIINVLAIRHTSRQSRL